MDFGIYKPQDSFIPIYITFTYDKWKTLKIPINPDVLKKVIPSSSETVNIVGLGEVSVPQTPKLAEMTIDSFFWLESSTLIPPALYVNWLEEWQKSKKPAFMVVTRFNFSMWVTCENFEHWINAGEEEDVYYTLSLKEYKHYGAKKIKGNVNSKLVNKINTAMKAVGKYAGYAICVDIPRLARTSNKETIYNPYTVKNGDTLSSISKKITGDTKNWNDLYIQNKETIADSILSDGLIVGTKLTLPDSWVSNSSYNIVTLEGGNV